MVYIFTALYCEAHSFIIHFNLKKDLGNPYFQHFYNEEAGIRLTISGVGEIAAAAAVSSICTKYKPQKGDFLFNIGVCGGTAKQGEIFLAHKLVEQATGKNFYPDILYRHSFRETCVMTGMEIWNKKLEYEAASDTCLYDMEAAAIYQAGAYYFGPHQMVFIKIVSDHGEGKVVLPEQVEQLIGQHSNRIIELLQQLAYFERSRNQSESRKKGYKEENMELLIQKLCMDMKCSKAMEDSLRRYLRYAALDGRNYESEVWNMYQEKQLPCKDKKEGKLCFERFKQRLL